MRIWPTNSVQITYSSYCTHVPDKKTLTHLKTGTYNISTGSSPKLSVSVYFLVHPNHKRDQLAINKQQHANMLFCFWQVLNFIRRAQKRCATLVTCKQAVYQCLFTRIACRISLSDDWGVLGTISPTNAPTITPQRWCSWLLKR